MFSPSAASGGYTFRARAVNSAAWKEGAEVSDPNLWIDGTDPSYSVVTTGVPPQAGSQSFHFAFPSFSDQSLEIDRALLPSITSELTFHYRRRYSGLDNTMSAEVSTDGGTSWNAIWSENGVCGNSCGSGDWDATWQSVSVPIGTPAGQPVRVRFIYRPIGLTYLGTDPNAYGFFIDEVSVTDSGSLGAETLTQLAAGSSQVDFVPTAAETYLLDLQAHLECLDSSFGPALTVVPEPNFFASIAAGLLALAVLGRRRSSLVS
jgi:hypothetical protein